MRLVGKKKTLPTLHILHTGINLTFLIRLVGKKKTFSRFEKKTKTSKPPYKKLT
jgi:hypothetical protein